MGGSADIFVIEGDVIGGESEKMKDSLLGFIREGKTEITLDFAKVTLIDSHGIGVLIAAQNTLSEKSGKLKIINLGEDLAESFTVMRLNRHFTIEGKPE